MSAEHPSNPACRGALHPRATAPAFLFVPLLACELSHPEQEIFVAMGFDCRDRLVHWASADGSATSVATILPAVRRILGHMQVACLLVAHSHPKHSCQPSPCDIETTARLATFARIAGCTLLDHLIIGIDGAYSCLSKQQIGPAHDIFGHPALLPLASP